MNSSLPRPVLPSAVPSNLELDDAAMARVELPVGALANARKALDVADSGTPVAAAPSRRKTNA